MIDFRKLILANTAILGFALAGCSSHLISSGLPDGSCAGGDCRVGQTSVFGRAGASSAGATGAIPEECGDRGFTRVEVRRDFGQGLATVLTLGAVNPATLHFSCKKPEQRSEIECNSVPGVPGVIECVRPATDARPEAVRFDCVVTPDTSDPDAIAEFTCTPSQAALGRILRFLHQSRSARG